MALVFLGGIVVGAGVMLLVSWCGDAQRSTEIHQAYSCGWDSGWKARDSQK